MAWYHDEQTNAIDCTEPTVLEAGTEIVFHLPPPGQWFECDECWRLCSWGVSLQDPHRIVHSFNP